VTHDLHQAPDLADLDSPQELRRLVGDKAAEMVELERDVRALGAPFPGYTVVGVRALADFHARTPIDRATLTLPEWPDAMTVPFGLSSQFSGFREVLTELLADREGTATVLRSSMCWLDAKRDRPPGLDSTLVVPSWPPSGPLAFPGNLYKAYATLCHQLHGLPTDTPRDAGLIVMDLLPKLIWQGTAYVRHSEPIVEVAPWGGGGQASRFPDATALLKAGPLARGTAERLCALLVDLAAKTGAESHCVELEFLIDADDEPLVLQRRSLPGDAGIFHTPGTYRGPVVDLRSCLTSNPEVVDEMLASAAGKAAVLPLLEAGRLDAFTLAWRLRDKGLSAPAALVLVPQPGSRSGMPSHIPWLLREALPGTLLIISDAPAQVTACRLASDGITASASWPD
jgi:hypothetical protein